MKKNQSAFFRILGVCFYAVFVLSCSKTNDPTNGAVTAASLKLDKEIYNGEYKQYTYNANGQCILINKNESAISYDYRSNTIIATTNYSDPTKEKLVQTYALNALGLAASCTYEIGTKAYLIEYEYNSDKQPIKITQKSKAATKTTYSTDVTQLYKYNGDGDCTAYTYQLSFTNVMYQYEYDKTHLNTTGNEYNGLDWLGKSSTHVRSLMIITTGFYPPDWNSKTEFANYSWTHDAQGYNKQYLLSGALEGVGSFKYK